jgi:hypothetical protein
VKGRREGRHGSPARAAARAAAAAAWRADVREAAAASDSLASVLCIMPEEGRRGTRARGVFAKQNFCKGER